MTVGELGMPLLSAPVAAGASPIPKIHTFQEDCKEPTITHTLDCGPQEGLPDP